MNTIFHRLIYVGLVLMLLSCACGAGLAYLQ